MKLRNPMKLSEETINILKNFGSINQSIMVKEGNVLRTISVMKNILAEARVTESFPRDFGIYDLNKLLRIHELYKNPSWDFGNESYLLVKEDRSSYKFGFSDPNVIVSPPDKEISLPSEDAQFILEKEDLNKLLKISYTGQLPDLSAIGDGSTIRMVARDKKNPNSDAGDIVVGTTDATFEFNFKVENIKLVPGNYEVVISSKLLSKFSNQDQPIHYYIALEPDSTYSG